MRLGRPRPWTIAGLLLCLSGGVLIQAWGGVTDIQRATTPAEFAVLAHNAGNQLRWASGADIILFAPGYLILLLAAYRRLSLPAGGYAVAALAFAADQTENLFLQLGLGRVSLDPGGPGVVHPDGWLIAGLRVANIAKWVLLAAAAIGLLVGWWQNRVKS
ncbi:MAG: hypothetical protein GY929_24355 [Actinomycetia bacterium]|nr:hypothetical protein [Actinomycetes bacterium]